jgi:hypothetical protein
LSSEESNMNRTAEPRRRSETRNPGSARLAWMKISRDRNRWKTPTGIEGRKTQSRKMRTCDWLMLHDEKDQLLLTRAARENPNKGPRQKNKARVNLRSSPKIVRKMDDTHKIQNEFFPFRINKNTTDPRRSPPSLPHLIVRI